MPDVLEPLDINQSAVEIAVTAAVFSDLPNTPLARWLEYRAYQELVQILRSADELPPDYRVLTVDARSLRDWLISGRVLKRRFSDETLHLFTQLEAAGGNVFNNICRFYCEWKKTGELTTEAAQLILSVPVIAVAIAAAGWGFLLTYGLPIAALIALLLHSGVLDKVCKCAERLEAAQA